jgi:DNA-directed RNA polymerase subunit M/transcription elongation factor TFIIS
MAKICEACGKQYRFPVGFGDKICRNCIIHCPKCGKKKGLLTERQISKQRK